MLDKGKELDWFASGEIIAMAVVAVVAFAVFVVWELTDEHPVVDPRLFRAATSPLARCRCRWPMPLFFGTWCCCPCGCSSGLHRHHGGHGAGTGGPVCHPADAAGGPQGGPVGPAPHGHGAFVVFALVLWMRSQFTTQTDFVHPHPHPDPGRAMAFFFIPLTTLTLSGLGPERIPAAAGLSNFARITAGAMGVSISTTLWESRAACTTRT